MQRTWQRRIYSQLYINRRSRHVTEQTRPAAPIYRGRVYQNFWLILLLLSLPLTASAVNSNQLENQRLQADRQADTYNALEDKQASAETMYGKQVGETEATLRNVEAALNTSHDRIAQKENELKTAEADILSKTEQLNILVKEQDDSLIRLYEIGTPSTTEMLIGTNNISEVEDRTEYISAFQAHLNTLIVSINQVKGELEAKQAQLKEEQAKLSDLRAQQEAQKNGLEGERQRLVVLKDQAGDLKEQYHTLAQNAEAKKRQFDEQLAKMAKSPGVAKTTRGRVKKGDIIGYMGSTGYCWSPDGGFGTRSCAHTHFSTLKNGDYVNPRSIVGTRGISWPFSNFAVAQEYGQPNWEAKYEFHNGIDIVSEDGYGAPIRAAADGNFIEPYPEYNGWMPDGYGRYVVIDHGGGIWSLYGHLTR